MKGIIGALSATNIHLVRESTQLRFKDPAKFRTPEALILYEQSLMPEEKILEICNAEYGDDIKLETPVPAYIPRNMAQEFAGRNCVPIRYDATNGKLYVGVIPELDGYIPDVGTAITVRVTVPIYYYVKLYARYYGNPDFLYDIPAADKLNMIITEAVSLKAADITITNVAEGATIYYNVRKRKVPSHRAITRTDVDEFTKILAIRAGQPIEKLDNYPRYLSVQLDLHNRGRVVINRTYYGRALTIRVLPDGFLTTTLEDLNISPNNAEFIRNVMLNKDEKGLRLFIGETMSGKNTTILSALRELTALKRYKIVSIENPVETLVEGVEQINTESEDEYRANAASLLRQNPDIVYITEITNYTALDTIQTANTGKVVFSTIHANSISDVISRLMDITGFNSDRLLLSMQSCCYQELVRDEEHDTIHPVNRCLHFTDELKTKLYGKSVGEVKQILQEVEMAWVP